MKLVFAIKSLDVRGGGAERVLVDVANGLSARGHDITVMTFDQPGASSFYPLDEGIARVDLAVGPPGQPTPRLALLRSIPRMRRITQDLQPDLVVGFMHSMYVPLGVAMFRSGIPVVASEHTGAAHFLKRPLQRALTRLGRLFFTVKTVPSIVVRDEHDERDRTNIVVLPNPLDLGNFAGIKSRPPRLPPIILSVGRLMEEKNHVELISAFKLLADKHPEWILRIVGDGVLRRQVEAHIKQNGLAGRVQLPGMIQDVATEYERASIVVVPSRYESFGMVTAEAQASGRPVIGFADCPGTNELIRDGENGLLVSGEGDRVANLANGIQRLITDAGLRQKLGAAGPASVQQFALENVLNAWGGCFLKAAAH